ncbi:MAG TPA: SDR family oxidoreductase [Acidimicrobiales bacterium]|jgi:short-subunit dehydrogenase|nr:SDR family oxidoreductase [Acidimicrobiales bacterium]
MTDLVGLRALITGGSSGIGAATAKTFFNRGMRVAITGRNVEALREVAASVKGPYLPGDLREAGCAHSIVDAAATALGGLDIVVSSAGVGWAGPFLSMSEAEIDALVDVNLRAALQLARFAVPHLQMEKGRLVFVGSIAGLVGVPGEACYSVTKAALSCMTDVLREELRPVGVGVSLISPGAVDTPFFERRQVPYVRRRPQMLSADDVAEAIVDVIIQHRDHVITPAWLSLPARLKRNLPGAYRVLANRFG